MSVTFSALIGYFLGCINPAAMISVIKKYSLRDKGTGNLGATNVALLFGKKYGVIVMLFDIFKSFIAYHIAKTLFVSEACASMIAGVFAVIGHCFPFYLGFKGGKGLAAFGGIVLAFDPMIFALLLGIAVVLMLIVNYSFVVPYTGGLLFPLLAYIKSGNAAICALAAVAGALIMCRHFENVVKAMRSTDITVRAFYKRVLKKHKVESDADLGTNDTNE